MAAIGVAGRSSRDSDRQKCPKRRVVAPRQGRGAIDSNLGVFGESKRVFNVYPEIAHGILDLAMTEQDLNGSKVAGGSVDDRRLRSAQGMCAILALHQADSRYPFIDQSSILSGAEMSVMINPAWKNVVVHRATPPVKPGQQAGPSVWKQFELNWPTCFLLHDYRACSNLPAADKVAYLHLHQVAASEFAVDRQIEQRPISQPAALIKVEPDFPYLLRFQRSLCSDGSSGIPDLTLGGGGLGFRHLHDRSPMASVAIGRTLSRMTVWCPREAYADQFKPFVGKRESVSFSQQLPFDEDRAAGLLCGQNSC